MLPASATANSKRKSSAAIWSGLSTTIFTKGILEFLMREATISTVLSSLRERRMYALSSPGRGQSETSSSSSGRMPTPFFPVLSAISCSTQQPKGKSFSEKTKPSLSLPCSAITPRNVPKRKEGLSWYFPPTEFSSSSSTEKAD